MIKEKEHTQNTEIRTEVNNIFFRLETNKKSQ